MIIKITYKHGLGNITIPMEKSEGRHIYGECSPKDFCEQQLSTAAYLTRLSKLVAHLDAQPDADILDAIEGIMLIKPDAVTVTKKSKKYRVYFIPLLYIHEEDK